MNSYTITIGIEELTMLTLAADDRARDLRDRAKLARDKGYALVNVEQLDESATEYETLVARLRRTPQNSPELTALLNAGEADREPVGGETYAVTLDLGLTNRPTITLAGPHEAAQLAVTLHCDGWQAYVSANVEEWCEREGFMNMHAIRPVSDLNR